MSRTQRAILVLFSVALALSFAAFAQKPAAPSAEEADVRAADEQWSQVASAKDLERTLSFYTEDAILPWPNAPAVVGKAAIREVWAADFQDPAYAISWHAEEVVVAHSGELAYSRGSYDATYTLAGQVVREHGKYLAVWKKQPGGAWKVAVDMYNAEAPAAPTKP